MALYFARIEGDPADAPVKIGYTNNPARRLLTLQTGHYRAFEFLRVVEGSPADELRIHAMFQHLRVRGEWFRRHDAMMGDLGLCDLPIPKLTPPRLRGQPMSEHHRRAVSDAMKKSWAPGGRLRETFTIQTPSRMRQQAAA